MKRGRFAERDKTNMTETRKIVIGSRESALALVQSEMVRDYITRPETGVTAEILKMSESL